MKFAYMAGVLLLAGLCPAVQAHITLETRTARIGQDYEAVLRVGHGCRGSDTTRLRVRIPEGVLGIEARPRAGWTLDLIEGAYAAPLLLRGAPVDHGVREIRWDGELPDGQHASFAFRAWLSPTLKPGQTLYFPVVQECRNGVVRWIDTSGQAQAEHPAPGVKLLAPAPAAPAHGQ